MALRDYCAAQGWELVADYIDHAPANDLAHRTSWRKLLDDAAKKRFSAVLVFKLDRAFRSVKHMHDTLAAWELVGVGFLPPSVVLPAPRWCGRYPAGICSAGFLFSAFAVIRYV